MGNVEKDRHGDYFGPIDHKHSLQIITPQGDVLKADVYHARDSKRAPWRLAFCYGSGRFAGMAGKYAYFRTKRELLAYWHDRRDGVAQP